MTDKDLIRQLQQGSQAAVEPLVRRYHRPLVAYFYRLSHDYHLAQDLAQECLFRLVSRADQYRYPLPLKPWIYRIAVNLWRDVRKSAAYRQGAAALPLDRAVVRAEVLGPLILMGLTASVLLLDQRVDERWGASPRGLHGLFLQRWLLTAAYYVLAIGLFIRLAGARAGDVSEVRVFASSLVTGALFSGACHLFHHLSGSPVAGWAAGLAVYFVTLAIATIWCPYDSVYQLWLPFAGLSDATAQELALSKGVYALAGLALLGMSARLLTVPERLIRGND